MRALNTSGRKKKFIGILAVLLLLYYSFFLPLVLFNVAQSSLIKKKHKTNTTYIDFVIITSWIYWSLLVFMWYNLSFFLYSFVCCTHPLVSQGACL